jgi:hypothetical protein
MNYYKATEQQIYKAYELGFDHEIKSYFYSVANWSKLTTAHKIKAYKFSLVLFTFKNKANIWDFGVYC